MPKHKFLGLQHWLRPSLDSTIRQQHPLLNKGAIVIDGLGGVV
jgi:hypothetical protein